MVVDILIAHPLKHHVFNFTVGCQNSGFEVRLITPLYKKGLINLLSRLPGTSIKKLNEYYHPRLNSSNVISPLWWQLKRLLTFNSNRDDFNEQFDLYIENLFLRKKIKTKILVTMQDYMPRTVAVAKSQGVLIWSDQILNSSNDVRNRIALNLLSVGHKYIDDHNEKMNKKILSECDVVTVPNQYTLKGVLDRIKPECKVYQVPYGADEVKFVRKKPLFASTETIRIIARANNIRKGGHLFLTAIDNCAESLSRLIGKTQSVEFNIIGTLDEIVASKIENLILPTNFSVRVKVIPSVDMPNEYNSSHLFIMPSLTEGMSLMCIEAMKMALPIIITEECGIDFFSDRKMGIQIIPTVESISKALVYAFENIDKWEAWGNECAEKAKTLTWTSYETKIKDTALSILNG